MISVLSYTFTTTYFSFFYWFHFNILGHIQWLIFNFVTQPIIRELALVMINGILAIIEVIFQILHPDKREIKLSCYIFVKLNLFSSCNCWSLKSELAQIVKVLRRLLIFLKECLLKAYLSTFWHLRCKALLMCPCQVCMYMLGYFYDMSFWEWPHHVLFTLASHSPLFTNAHLMLI